MYNDYKNQKSIQQLRYTRPLCGCVCAYKNIWHDPCIQGTTYYTTWHNYRGVFSFYIFWYRNLWPRGLDSAKKTFRSYVVGWRPTIQSRRVHVLANGRMCMRVYDTIVVTGEWRNIFFYFWWNRKCMTTTNRQETDKLSSSRILIYFIKY